MEESVLIPHLFRTEYRKIVSVLCYRFGIDHIETAEDIVSDTFLTATETWSMKGIPENPTAWLYTVAKNKTKNYLRHHAVFEQKLAKQIQIETETETEIDLDLSDKNINDSQLAMMFTICAPVVSKEAQIALALNLLCGFGVQEIADGFLTGKDTIYKRLKRAKEKLKEAGIKIEQPKVSAINQRLETVLTTLYLLFSEGYYSVSNDVTLRKDVCAEAMRLNYLLISNPLTDLPPANALFALMCFHASRFDARADADGTPILYGDQDEKLWNKELIEQGIYYLNRASKGDTLTKYHLEAAIAYWHTHKADRAEKWENILQLYNQLLILEYSPIIAMNRTFALAKTNGKAVAIAEAEKLNLDDNHLYFSLLGNLYTGIDDQKALKHFKTAIDLAVTAADKKMIDKSIQKLSIN
ncbi:sigma-70 family RNA polymerase sigma factor [Pedobacter sp. HDW13]|uniref:RNA polymerase sigma factor n=1 Tax=Pedobacter sp. HDW13 TaxID=2714940 RepID=UPI0014089390|nr:sigma-70 family RNA polymerase sigma factor [Pedobacter sp. HDW13]QIL38031.1 sigma-70 family RNA polymerase sigma factor [Pedobacter sp. HDW13]